MENPKKKRAQDMYTTLKECLTNPEFLRALEIMSRNEKNVYKNHMYG